MELVNGGSYNASRSHKSMENTSKSDWIYPRNNAAYSFLFYTSMIIQTMKNLVDPRTKTATAFYMVLGIACWDVITRGFDRFNSIILAAMAIPGVIGVIAQAIGYGAKEATGQKPVEEKVTEE
jgi:hypothetical protein